MTLEEITILASNIRATFNTPQGEETIRYLEGACCWYESVYDPVDRDRVLLNAGRREVLATIKTFLTHPPDKILQLTKGVE